MKRRFWKTFDFSGCIVALYTRMSSGSVRHKEMCFALFWSCDVHTSIEKKFHRSPFRLPFSLCGLLFIPYGSNKESSWKRLANPILKRGYWRGKGMTNKSKDHILQCSQLPLWCWKSRKQQVTYLSPMFEVPRKLKQKKYNSAKIWRLVQLSHNKQRHYRVLLELSLTSPPYMYSNLEMGAAHTYHIRSVAKHRTFGFSLLTQLAGYTSITYFGNHSLCIFHCGSRLWGFIE